jgi:hypothetical protein
VLYQIAIVQRPTAEEYAVGAGEALVYGPVSMMSREGSYQNLTAQIVAEAASKAPGFAWNDRMYVAGHRFDSFD